MPIRRKNTTPAPEPAPAPKPGIGLKNLFPQKMQDTVDSWGDWGGTAARVASGFVGNVGSWPGALAGAGGEGLAQFLESSLDKNTTPYRIGVEGAIGAIPFGKLAGGARAATAMTKTGLAGGAGDVGRQWGEGNFDEDGEGLNVGRSLLTTLISAVTGGVVNKIQTRPPKVKEDPWVIESSGAVPKDVSPTGLPMGNTPKSTAGKQRDYLNADNQSIPSGGSVLSAGRSLPKTDNYNGGVSEITGLNAKNPVPSGQIPPAIIPASGRIPYAAAEDEASMLADLEKQFGLADAAADSRFSGFQKLADNFESTLEKTLSGKLDSLPNRNVEDAVAGEKMLGDASQASDKLAKAWEVEDIDALDDQFGRAMNTADTRFDALLAKGKEDAKRELIQRRRNAAGLEKSTSFSSTVSSTTPTGVKETMTTRFKPTEAAEDGASSDESVKGMAALTDLLGGKTGAPATVVEQIRTAVQNASAKIRPFLLNLDEDGLDAFNYYTTKEALSDVQAYRKAFQEQGVRQARERGRMPIPRAAETLAEPTSPVKALDDLLTPKQPIDPDQLRQTTHPSFYDEGVEGLEDANDLLTKRQSTHPSFYDDGFDNVPMAPGKSTISPAASEKLAGHMGMADPATASKLAEASAIYNDPNASKEAKKAAGKSLRQLSKMLEGPPNPKDEKGFANIETMLSTAFGLGGAATGAAIDGQDGDDSIWDGAAIGGAAGLGAVQLPKALNALKSSVDPTNLEDVRAKALAFVQKLPQIERFSLLMNPQGFEPEKLMETGNPIHAMPALAINAMAGPYGAVLTHAIEAYLKGDPRGIPLLKMAWNPAKFVKGMWDSSDEAWQALVKGEEGRAANLSKIDPDSHKDKLLAFPGQAMTMGDTYARKLLSMAGYSDDEARVATLTSEPGKAWRGLANSAKNNVLMQMMFPFRRTPVNIMEQGSTRLPLGLGAGFGPERSGHDKLVEAGLGTIASGGAYALAASTEDDTARRNVRRLVSNMGGKYSLPATIGFTAGDAKARGLKGVNSVVNDQSVKNIFPLPSTDVPVDTLQKLLKIANGEAKGLTDYSPLPTAMTMKPLRTWLGDRMPQLRDELQDTAPQARHSTPFSKARQMIEEILIGVGIIAIPSAIGYFFLQGQRLTKLESVEVIAKELLTSRAATVEAKLDAISAQVDLRFNALEQRIDRIERKVLNGDYHK